MKKVLLSAIAGFLSVAVVSADQHAQEKQTEDAGYCPFNGVYVAAGIGGSFYKHEADVKATLANGSCVTVTGPGGSVNAPINFTNNRLYINGIDVTDYISADDINDIRKGAAGKHVSLNHSRFIGTLAFGGGKVFANNFYLGGEVMCDFGSSKRKDDIKMSAVSPSLGLRLGYYNRNINTLFYTKLMASYTSTRFESDDLEDTETLKKTFGSDVKIAKFAPAIALGVEKAFGKKLSARLEAEYRFASKKTFNGKYNISSDCNHDAVNAHINVLGNTELKAKTTGGWNVRALVVYNINCL